MKNGYTIVDSGRDITGTKDYWKDCVPRTTIYETYKLASERRKVALSYRSAHSKSLGITAVILKVENGKII